MKHLSMLLCATLLAVAAPVPSASAQAEVSIDFFYDALSPHGDWIYADDYGYVFQPAVSSQDDWAPYSDGYWAYTDAGWTWISEEEFGWATYHYGRWIRMHNRWTWVPGNEWAPAWVSWRESDDHIGWAPLPPEASWSASIGFNEWTDSYYDVGPSYYNFVPLNLFARRTSLRPIIINRSRNVTYVDRSRNITNISYRQNVVNNIFVGGPDPDRIDRVGENRLRRLTLRRDEDGFRRDWLDNRGDRPRGIGSLSRIDRDELIVAAPSFRRDGEGRLPERVRERFERSEVDRGWRNVENRELSDRLRERNRADFAKNKPATLPEKALQLVTGRQPPPAVGRVLKPEERRVAMPAPMPAALMRKSVVARVQNPAIVQVRATRLPPLKKPVAPACLIARVAPVNALTVTVVQEQASQIVEIVRMCQGAMVVLMPAPAWIVTVRVVQVFQSPTLEIALTHVQE